MDLAGTWVCHSMSLHLQRPRALLLSTLCIWVTVENGMMITLGSSPKRFWEAVLIAPGKDPSVVLSCNKRLNSARQNILRLGS